MLLRDHPTMSYRGFPSWPPFWTWTNGFENNDHESEILVFKNPRQKIGQPVPPEESSSCQQSDSR
jgi:hypothetical protein